MKTAAEMRAASPKFTVQNTIAEIEQTIESYNKQGQLEVRLSAATKHPDRHDWIRDWVTCRDNITVEGVIKVLRDAGYAVRELYEEGQFVDSDIIISWAE